MSSKDHISIPDWPTTSISGRAVIAPSDLLAGDVKLAAPPELFLRINALLDDPGHSQKQLVALIEHDPSLSARLLKIVNSPFYGFACKIDSVARAIGIVGILELRDLVLATAVVDRFSALPNSLMSMKQFWAMSVKCALIARGLAMRHSDSERLQCPFVCGLLHEIGRLVVYHRLPELARAAHLRSRHEHIPEHEAQQREMGLDHYQVGAELARRWRLPEVIAVTIEKHAAPDEAGPFLRECLLVSLAMQLSLPEEEDESASRQESEAWTRLELSGITREEVLTEAEATFIDVFKQIYPAK